MAQLSPYIHFNGICREAMTFYQECLGGELDLQTIGGSPIEAQCPAGMKDQVLHGTLTKGDFILMGSDMTAPGGYLKGNNIAFSLNCSSKEEIEAFFSHLSEKAHIIDPLGTKFWGALFGVFDDKYGIRWMLHYDKNQPSK